MTHSDDKAIRQEAARWFQRRIGGDCTPDEEARFHAWLKANPLHTHEYRALEKIWARLDELPLDPEMPPGRPGRRGFLRAAASAALVVVVATTAVFGYRWHIAQPLYAAHYETRAGERAHVDLPDGSKLELGVRTRLGVTFYRDRREVVLEAGEAYFSVAHDASHPFRVQAGGASVLVTGTRFAVRFVEQAALVALDEGAIEFSATGAETARLAAPAAARSDGNGIGILAAAEVDRLTGWRRGQLVFHDQPLAEVAGEISRYRQKPVTVADAGTAALKVTGIAFVEKPDAFLDGLAGVLPVALERAADGAIVIRALPGE